MTYSGACEGAEGGRQAKHDLVCAKEKKRQRGRFLPSFLPSLLHGAVERSHSSCPHTVLSPAGCQGAQLLVHLLTLVCSYVCFNCAVSCRGSDIDDVRLLELAARTVAHSQPAPDPLFTTCRYRYLLTCQTQKFSASGMLDHAWGLMDFTLTCLCITPPVSIKSEVFTTSSIARTSRSCIFARTRSSICGRSCT